MTPPGGARTMNFAEFRFLSFDCYGTLIDWETGILGALRPVFAAHGKQVPDPQILAAYAEREHRAEQPPYRRYREILTSIVQELGLCFGFAAKAEEQAALPDSLAGWLPFPDTVAALRTLRKRYRLGILSNVDDDLFAASARRLEVDFDLVITAQQVGAYKPSLLNFERMRSQILALGMEPKEWLHVAQSRPHDIVPARALGIPNVWVNRPVRYGASAVTEAAVEPDIEVGSLAELVSLMQPPG
jgi:2-haloacid dehalogenase